MAWNTKVVIPNRFIRMPKTKRKVMRPTTGPLHIMLLPAVILVFIYSYLPMFGVIIAFQDFDIYKGVAAFWESEWVGLKNYIDLWNMGVGKVILNTINISFWKLSLGFLVPVIVAVLLNEINKTYVKRTVQTIIYMPHFLSWVILGGIVKQLLLSDGIINNMLLALGMENPIPFLQSNTWFVPTVVLTHIWKEFGFGTIVYLAAISGIDPTLYEAAVVDGATKWKQIWHITLPGMRPILLLTLVLSLQGVLNAGFDQIFNLYSPQVYETGDIIDTFVFRLGFESSSPMYDLATAVGLLKSVVSTIFICVSYWLAYKFTDYRIF